MGWCWSPRAEAGQSQMSHFVEVVEGLRSLNLRASLWDCSLEVSQDISSWAAVYLFGPDANGAVCLISTKPANHAQSGKWARWECGHQCLAM